MRLDVAFQVFEIPEKTIDRRLHSLGATRKPVDRVEDARQNVVTEALDAWQICLFEFLKFERVFQPNQRMADG